MANRRDIFKYVFGSTVVAAGIGATKASAKGAPDDLPSMSIGGQKKDNNSGFVSCTQDHSRAVSFAVGNDGHLWIKTKVNNVWERVNTEIPQC